MKTGLKKMQMISVEKLLNHFENKLEYKKEETEQVIASIRKMPIPDIVSRRVCETECLMLRIVIRDIKRLAEES